MLNLRQNHFLLNGTRILALTASLLLLSGCDKEQTPQQTLDFLTLCHSGQRSEIETALSQGIKVNSALPQGISCLMIAAHQRRADVVKLLLDKGANPHQKTRSGVTALMLGIGANSNPDLLKMMIAAKGDVNIPSADGSTPLMIALGSHASVLAEREAIDNLRINSPTDNREMTIPDLDHEYSQYPKPDMQSAQILIDAKANVNAKDYEGNTALDYVIIREYDPGIITFLVNAGADISAGTGYGATPLEWALHNQNPEYVRLLLAYGAKVNNGHQGRETLLFPAVRASTPEIVGLLIKHGADINYQAPKRKTPLMAAVWANKPENVEVLIKAGADINLKDERGVSALGISEGSIREMLIKSGGIIRGQEVWMAETDLQKCTGKLFDTFLTTVVSSRVMGVKAKTLIRTVESCANFDDVALFNYLDKFAPEITPADGSHSMKSNYYGVPIECQIIESEPKCKIAN